MTVVTLLLLENPHPLVRMMLTINLAITGAITVLGVCGWLARIKTVVTIAGLVAYSSMVAYMFHRQVMHVFIFVYWPENPYVRLVYVLCLCVPTVILFGYAGQKIHDLCLNRVLGKRQPQATATRCCKADGRP